MGLFSYLSHSLLYHYMLKEVTNVDAPLTEPSFTSSIILPTFNEVDYLQSTLASLQQQNIMLAYPDKFELIIIDSESTDGTLDLIKKYTSNILTASGPKGKLSARHLAIQHAKGEIIISVDADTFYPANWLNLMLRHFSNPDVVGVSSPRMFMFPNTFHSLSIAFGDSLFRSMRGSNSAFRKSAYGQSGGFNLNIDQLDITQMIWEEEVMLQRRLRQLGKVIYDFQAPIFTSNRRWLDKKHREEVRRGLRF
mgnify:CR=1 FL=1